jgi:phospholipase/carboxylesterase
VRRLYILLAAIGIIGGLALFLYYGKEPKAAAPEKEQRIKASERIFKPANGKAPKKLIIVMHGYGANAENMWPVGYEISKALPEVEVRVPDGFDPCDGNVGGRQWFKMGNWTLPEWCAQLTQTKARFDAYLSSILAELHFSEKDVALVGFSQGAMMALYFGVQCGVQAVVGFSGVFVDPDVLNNTPFQPHILLVHGDADNVIPPKAFFQAQEILRAHHVPFEAFMRPHLGHSIDTEGLQHACDFLKEHLIP